MTGVIYADVLFILNVYITYALLMLTALFLRQRPKRLRLLLAGVLGGFSSFLILIPHVSTVFMGVLRVVLCLVFSLVAFKFNGIKQLTRQSLVFLCVNFLFAGIMLAIWYFISPTAVYYNSGVVYFDIDTLSLIIITAVCYFLIKAFGMFTSLRTPKNTIYDVYLQIAGDEFFLKGFLDTGNNLKDPFTSSDVIVISRSAVEKYFPMNKSISEIIGESPLKIRYLPCITVSGSKLLPVFKCDKMRIKGISADFSLEGVIVAVSDENIKNGEFQALLPEGIFQNNYSDKGEDYEEAERFFAGTCI